MDREEKEDNERCCSRTGWSGNGISKDEAKTANQPTHTHSLIVNHHQTIRRYFYQFANVAGNCCCVTFAF
jgi:hypothetical protein